MVEVQCLAVEIARRLADLEELLDLGVRDVEIAGRRTAPQRTLRNGQRQAVHHPHEGNDAAGLAVEAHRLTDPAHVAPIGADPAAAAGQPDVLVPGADDPFEAVGHRIEIAADRKPPVGPAVRQHRGGGHEPQLRDVVVEPLGVALIVGIGGGDAGEQILIAFAGEQVAVVERFLAEVGQQRIACAVGHNLEAAVVDRLAVIDRRSGGGHGAGQRLGAQLLDQTGRTGIVLVRHRQRRALARLLARLAGSPGHGLRLGAVLQAYFDLCHRRLFPVPEIHLAAPVLSRCSTNPARSPGCESASRPI